MAGDHNKILTLVSTIKELGHHNSRRDELRDFCKSNIEQILKILPRHLLNSDGGNLLDCIFNGLPDGPATVCANKVKIVDIVLKTMSKESTSLTHCGEVIGRLCLELPRLPRDDLVRWANDSVQTIVDDNDVNMIWRDVLPECLRSLSSEVSIKHCGTEMSTADFKGQIVNVLCQCRWKDRQMVQLAAMFKDMQLTKNEHNQLVNKMCSYIIDVPPDALPPLVHQLLKLCKTQHLEVVLSHLSHYFSVRLYQKLEPPPQDSESTTMDIDDIVQYSPAELSRCLSTCIYHITQGVAEAELVRKHIKMWPKTQLLRAPFIIDLALALSTKGPDYKAACLDPIKSSIELRASDAARSLESAWVRSLLPPDTEAGAVLKVLTAESVNHRELTVSGLISLAFLLLSSNKPAARASHLLGELILVRLSRSMPETCDHIMFKLADVLAAEGNKKQHVDCLYALCKLAPVSVERSAALQAVLYSSQPSETRARSGAVLRAVRPLLAFSTRARDALCLLCRKGLHSRQSGPRSLALAGFLSLLRHVKLTRGTLANSQSCSEFSAHSYLTQLTVDLHATQGGNTVKSRIRNEAICMEVVSILRRCLVQDAAIKQLLYAELYECVKEKPVLHEPALELLHEHLTRYLPDDDDVSVLMDKCLHVGGATVTLTEPIAYLLYCIAQFLQAVEEDDLEDILASQTADTGSAYLKSKLSTIMDTLCRRNKLPEIDMEDNIGLTDLTPESKAKALKVQQTLQCCEALIGHLVMQWSPETSHAASVYRLYKTYDQLLEQTKAKIGKKGSKTTLNDTKETTKSTQQQKSQKSHKEKGKTPAKLSSMVKGRAAPFKPLPCLWNPKFCLRIMELLYSETVTWSSLEQRNELRGRRDFHHFTLRCIQSVLSEELDRRDLLYVGKIAAVLYHRCVCRFREMCEFDDQTTLGCLELFKSCLSVLLSPTYALKIDSVMNNITGVEEPASSNIARILQEIHKSFLQIEEESEEERDMVLKKLLSVQIQTAVLLLETPVSSCPDISRVLIKLEDYIRSSKQDCLPLIGAILTASCREVPDSPLFDDLLQKLSSALGRIDEEDTSAGADDSPAFPCIDSASGHAALAALCAHAAARARHATHLLRGARDLAGAGVVRRARADTELKELYKGIVLQLCQLATWTCRISKLRCSIGQGSDRVLNTCVRLYALLATTAKQMPPHIAGIVRFERLLKLSGKKLSSVTDFLITYLEASQQQQSASRVLRDTKLIPRLVLEAEQFSNNVTLLGQKAKIDFQQFLSLGTARDFRIKGPKIQEVLNRAAEDADETRDDLSDAETEVIPQAESDEDGNSDDETARKRRRVS